MGHPISPVWAQNFEVNVSASKGGELPGVKVYAFTESGSYTGRSATTDGNGSALFDSANFADGGYKFRVDYLGNHFWSQVITMPGASAVEVVIEEETVEVTVSTASGPAAGVRACLFSEGGSYLGLYQITDAEGVISLDLPVGRNFKFRADILGGHYWSDIVTVSGGGVNSASVAAGGGLFNVTLAKAPGLPLSGIKVYLFSQSGSYLGLSGVTDADGVLGFHVPEGTFKVRADYLGYKFWSEETQVMADSDTLLLIPHQPVEITVGGVFQGASEPIVGIEAYLFSTAGSYMGQYQLTDVGGKVAFDLPGKAYKIRADYMGQQFWSAAFTWQETTVNVPMADIEITVTGAGLPTERVNVYVFSVAGSYLGVYESTDHDGKVFFHIPEGIYKFRADYLGSQFWSPDASIAKDELNHINISTGGGAFTVAVHNDAEDAIAGVRCYVFNASDSYLGLFDATDENGEVSFDLADGTYKFRVDYLGGRFWSELTKIPDVSTAEVVIAEETVAVTVQTAAGPAAGIKVYLFSEGGSYLGLFKVTDENGLVSFDLPVGGSFKFRADILGEQVWSGVMTVSTGGVNPVSVNGEGGLFHVTVENPPGIPIEGINVYLFNQAGSYLGLNELTDAVGGVGFSVPDGTFKVRADYMRYQFWSDETLVTEDKSIVLTIPHQQNGVTVSGVFQGTSEPIVGIKAYLFSSAGSYVGQYQLTDADGKVSFDLPEKAYKIRADYMGQKFWSDAFTWSETTINVPMADAVITVTGAGVPQQGVKVYVFSATGSYLGASDTTDDDGKVRFRIPEGSYKFRADKAGNQYWSSVSAMVADFENPVAIEIGATPVTVSISADPATISQGESSTLTWGSINADSCIIDPGIGSVDVNGSITVYPTETTTYTITATGAGGAAVAIALVTVIDAPYAPAVSISADPATIDIGESTLLSWSSTNADTAHIDNGVGVVSVDGSFLLSPEHTTTYTITATGAAGSANAKIKVMVTGDPGPQPEGSFGQQYEDLTPPDATIEEYDPKRFSVITGRVLAIDDSPIADVSVTLHGHLEYGTAATDAGGRFSIPVEGGGTLSVLYHKQGLIPSQRQVYVPWNDIATCETIQMIEEDPEATAITFDGDPDTIVTHRSTEVSDEFGARSCSMVFTGDNRAYLVDENGNDVHELTSIITRATEFTTPESMPAVLPPNVAFTYCSELTVDGADRVRFEKPVITWVDNFLGFDVGMIVPVGYYDRDRGVWVPSDNGVVVRLLDTDSDGVVDALDSTGDEQPNDLNGNGSFIDEVAGLEDTLSYPPDATFWRVEVSHFTPWDCNWGSSPPPGASPPEPGGSPSGGGDGGGCGDGGNGGDGGGNPGGSPSGGGDGGGGNGGGRGVSTGSFVEERSRRFHEDIPIPGTDMILHYASNRVKGYKTLITIPASGGTLPDRLKRIDVIVEIAGRTFKQSLGPQPNLMAEVVWDGLDYLGRPVNNTKALVSVGYVYDAIYNAPPGFSQAGIDLTSITARREITLWKRNNLKIHRMTESEYLLSDGWTVSNQHYLDPLNISLLYKGDGTVNKNSGWIIDTVAGTGESGYSGDGGPATEAKINSPRGVAVDAAGNFYIADTAGSRVRKVNTNGIITTVAGTGASGHSGDGGPAIDAELDYPHGVAVDASGNLYIADSSNSCVRKVDANGIITTVAGTGEYGYSGDGGLAVDAKLKSPHGVAVDSSGNLYIADTSNHSIRKVYANGTISTVAGTGASGYSGDWGPATEARLSYPICIAVDASGNLYIADRDNQCVRKVGILSDFTSAISTGDIIFYEENGLAYIMSSTGRHKKTIDLNTGATVYDFVYDADDNLISITDRFGNQTTVNRDGSGVPVSITSPYGLVTTLAIDANNHLTRITHPDGNTYGFEYTTEGLLTVKTEPEGNRFEHVFNDIGRLTLATDQEGGHWEFARSAYANGDILSSVTTGEGNVTSYLDNTDSTGQYTATITGPAGGETLFTRSADGLTVNKSLSCGMDLESKYGLDPQYKFKVVKGMRISTPSTLERVAVRNKTYEDTDSDNVTDRITQTVTVNGMATTLVNDVLQSRKTITSPEGRGATSVYDPDTLLTSSLNIPELHDTTFGYNSNGKLTSVNTNTRGTAFAYNDKGFLSSVTDSLDHTTSYTYDPVGRVTGINRPDGSFVGFTYDKNGNMTILTVPVTVNHLFNYNKVNRKDVYQAPISGTYSYVYDKDRRLISTLFPSGNEIKNVYDKTRLVQIQTPEESIELTYLCATKVGSITNGTDTITYGYDGKLVTSEIVAGTLNQSLSYAYNNDFNPVGFTYAGENESYTYDNDGLLTGAGDYIIARNAQNGLPEAVNGGSLSLSRTFNGYGEVEAQSHTINNQSLASWNLARNNSGRISGKTETVDRTTSNYAYTYDPMGRLLTVTQNGVLVQEYRYDANGTRNYEMNALRGIAGRTFTYSDEDHLLTAGSISYLYDYDGFLVSKTDGLDVTQFDYSTRGELKSVTLPGGTSIAYVHDPLGRRIAKKINGTIVEKYLWQGLTRLLAVYDGSDGLLTRFAYADGRMPVAMTRSDGTYYLAYDQVGSLRIVADASGNVVKEIEYDSFGNVITDTAPTFEVPFGFAGGLHDRDTGLVRFGYRDFDPNVGRWTAKDPIGFAGGDTDLYGYVLNNPINSMDPFGLFCEILEGPPFVGGDPIGQWTTQEKIGYWEAVSHKLAVTLLLSTIKFPIPDLFQYTYIIRFTTWQLFNIYIPFYEVCYDDCGEETREYIGKSATGKTQKVILNIRDIMKFL
jgi:RHS repeat-associated protein